MRLPNEVRRRLRTARRLAEGAAAESGAAPSSSSSADPRGRPGREEVVVAIEVIDPALCNGCASVCATAR